jgi:hypothetical protein
MGIRSEKGLWPYVSDGAKIAVIACCSAMFLVALVVATGYFFTDPADNHQKLPESSHSSSVHIAGDYIDNVPSWHGARKPRPATGRGRPVDMLFPRKESGAGKATVKEEPNVDPATRGEQLISRTLRHYRIDPVYNTPGVFGSRMVIWLPEEAWKRFSPEQKASIAVYMQSRYKSWGIGVGRVSGSDILADRLAIGTVGDNA